jgi:hypothetical protein
MRGWDMTDERLREIRQLIESQTTTIFGVATVGALLTHLDAVTAERDRLAEDLDRAVADVMMIAMERDAARAALVVSDDTVERAYAAWYAFKPTKDDVSGYGAMRAALDAARIDPLAHTGEAGPPR